MLLSRFQSFTIHGENPTCAFACNHTYTHAQHGPMDLKTIKCATATSACSSPNLPTLCSVCWLLERGRRVWLCHTACTWSKNTHKSNMNLWEGLQGRSRKTVVWEWNQEKCKISGQHVCNKKNQLKTIKHSNSSSLSYKSQLHSAVNSDTGTAFIDI